MSVLTCLQDSTGKSLDEAFQILPDKGVTVREGDNKVRCEVTEIGIYR